MGDGYIKDFSFLLIDFSNKIFENLFHKWGTTWEYIKLTTRSRKSKTYYLGIYGLLPTCSFYSDLIVAFWLISSEFIIKCAQQTGHLTVLSYKRNFGPPYSLILHIHDDHISVEGVIERDCPSLKPLENQPLNTRLNSTVNHLIKIRGGLKNIKVMIEFSINLAGLVLNDPVFRKRKKNRFS